MATRFENVISVIENKSKEELEANDIAEMIKEEFTDMNFCDTEEDVENEFKKIGYDDDEPLSISIFANKNIWPVNVDWGFKLFIKEYYKDSGSDFYFYTIDVHIL